MIIKTSTGSINVNLQAGDTLPAILGTLGWQYCEYTPDTGREANVTVTVELIEKDVAV